MRRCRSWLNFAGKRWHCLLDIDHEDWHFWWPAHAGVSLKWRRAARRT